MNTNSLMVITMGISFYLIPLLLIVATAVFIWRWRATRSSAEPRLPPVPREAIRDPLIVAIVLLVSGVLMVAFLTGRLSLDDYLSVPGDALGVLSETVTDWTDPLSADAIALRGGVLVAVASTVIVAVTLLSYYRERLRRSRDL